MARSIDSVAAQASSHDFFRSRCIQQKRYPSLDLTVIHARERGEPHNRARIDGTLITNLPMRSRGDVVEKLS